MKRKRLSKPDTKIPVPSLDLLPKEILIEIFEKLSVNELQALTETCRAFRDVINGNVQLSSKFTLNFDTNFKNREWIGSRKYTNLVINKELGIFSILPCIGDGIRDLKFKTRSIVLKNVTRILNFCPNLKNLTFEDVKTHLCLDLLNDWDLPRHTDVTVTIINTTPNVLQIFKQMQVRSLRIVGPTTTSDFGVCWNINDCRDEFAAFMKSQSALEELALENFSAKAKLFSDRAIEQVNFRLQKLKLLCFTINNVTFHQFLYQHIDTLEHIEVDNSAWTNELAMIASQCTKLREFSFYGHFREHRVLPRVEKLNMWLKSAGLFWQKMFPNVRELRISSNMCQVFQYVELFTHLTTLVIENSHFHHQIIIKLPAIKRFVMHNSTGCEYILVTVLPFNESVTEEIEIVNCTGKMSWLFYLMMRQSQTLKSVTLDGLTVSKIFRETFGNADMKLRFINCKDKKVGNDGDESCTNNLMQSRSC